MVHDLRQELLLEKHAAYIVQISQVSDQVLNCNANRQSDQVDAVIFKKKNLTHEILLISLSRARIALLSMPLNILE